MYGEINCKERCSAQLGMEFIILINIKIIDILTIISIINNRSSESLEVGKYFIIQHFGWYERLKFHAQLS